MNVFENHTEECKAAMAVQNAAIAAAQERLAERIATARSTEDEETMEARSKADAEMDAARAEHDDAVEAAQRVYGATLDHSRDTAWKIIQKRLSIWNGDLPEELPAAPTIEPTAQPQAATPNPPDVREFVLVEDLDITQRGMVRGSTMIEAMAPYVVNENGDILKSLAIEDEPAAIDGLPKIPLSAIYTRVKSNGGDSANAVDCLRAIAELIDAVGALDDKAA